MSTLQRRVERLEEVGGNTEAADEVMLVSGGEVVEMTPEQWREYERSRAGDFIRIREIVKGKLNDDENRAG